MVDALVDIIQKAGVESKKKTIVSFGQDRLDSDNQGSVALFDLILRQKYYSGSMCFYSKPLAFAMSRMINEILPGCFARVEHTNDIAYIVAKSKNIFVWDTANFS